jgi:hypothetical protein
MIQNRVESDPDADCSPRDLMPDADRQLSLSVRGRLGHAATISYVIID